MIFDKYLTGLGIDVSNHHIRIAQVSRFGSVKHLHEMNLPEGMVVDERIMKPNALRDFVEDQIKDAPFSLSSAMKTTLLIPESHVFTASFSLPAKLKKEELTELALRRAQKQIPVPFKDAEVAIAEGEKDDNEKRIAVHAVKRAVIGNLRAFVDPDHFDIIAMEANTNALNRFLQHGALPDIEFGDASERIAIVDIGHSWATLSVYTGAGDCMISRSISYRDPGEKIDLEADNLLSEEMVDKVLSMVDEIAGHFIFNGDTESISIAVLAGVEAIEDTMKSAIEARDKDTQYLIRTIGELVPFDHLSTEDIHTYGAAIGAALRSVRPGRYKYDHNFIS